MDSIWVAIVVLVAFLLVLRLKSRRKREPKEPKPFLRRIEGYQVDAHVHPRMSRACLFDNGLQYGKGFRRKEGPVLPHDEHCRCRATPFSFSSNEVFNGALRRFSGPTSDMSLPPGQLRELVEAMKRGERDPLPPDAEVYVGRVMEQGHLEPAYREEVAAFLRERHAFLMQHEAGGREGKSGAAPEDAPPPDRMGALKTS